MAIFETGSAVGVNTLLDSLAAFCVTNGWTQNYNAVEGAGRRVHLQLSTDVFINLRSLVNEVPTVGTGASVYGISFYGSTAYNGALEWRYQINRPNNGTTNHGWYCGVNSLPGAINTYYFFARGSMIYVWIETPTGNYQWLMFGRVTKTSAWAGGMFTAASANGIGQDQLFTGNLIMGNNGSFANPISARINDNAYLYGTVDGLTGWMCGNGSAMSPNMPKAFDSYLLDGNTFNNLNNTFNGQNVLMPVELCITRDGLATWNASTNFSIEAILPDLYFCNIRNLLPGQQIDDGSGDIFRVLPSRVKLVTNTGDNSGGWLGYAIKQN